MAHSMKGKDRTAYIAGGGSDDGMTGASKGRGGYKRAMGGSIGGGLGIEGDRPKPRLDRPIKGTTVNVNVVPGPDAGLGTGVPMGGPMPIGAGPVGLGDPMLPPGPPATGVPIGPTALPGPMSLPAIPRPPMPGRVPPGGPPMPMPIRRRGGKVC